MHLRREGGEGRGGTQVVDLTYLSHECPYEDEGEYGRKEIAKELLAMGLLRVEGVEEWNKYGNGSQLSLTIGIRMIE